MADPILPGGIRVLSILQGISGLPEDRFVNTWAFASDVASTEAAQTAAIAKVGNFFLDPHSPSPAVKTYLAGTSIDETLCEFRAYWMGEPPPRTPLIIPWSIGTLSSTQALPSEVACCLSFYAGTNQPRNRGRVFIGPFQIDAMLGAAASEPLVSDGLKGGLVRSAEAMVDDTTGPVWCVLGLNAAGTDRELKPVTAGWCDNAWDTQRRRGPDATSRMVFPV